MQPGNYEQGGQLKAISHAGRQVKEAKVNKTPAGTPAAALSAAAAPSLIGHGGWVASLTGPLPAVFNAAEAVRKNTLPGKTASVL